MSKPFYDRLGLNPEVTKKGVLKMATRLYNEGKYMEAMNKMSANFNIISLKNHMDPNYYKKILQQKIA